MSNKDVKMELNNIYELYSKTWSEERLAPVKEVINKITSNTTKKNVEKYIDGLNDYANTLIEEKGKTNEILMFKLKINRLNKVSDLEDVVGTTVKENVMDK